MKEMGFSSDEGASGFVAGTGIVIETQDGLEAGDLVGASMWGVIFRATHRMDTRELEPDEVSELEDEEGELPEGAIVTRTEMVPLARSVLTLLPWSEVKKIELAEEYLEEGVLRDFREALDVEEGIPSDLDLDEDLGGLQVEDEDSDGDED